MIILRKAKYGTGYRDLGHVARISTTLLDVPSLYTVCLLNMTDYTTTLQSTFLLVIEGLETCVCLCNLIRIRLMYVPQIKTYYLLFEGLSSRTCELNYKYSIYILFSLRISTSCNTPILYH